VNAAVPVLILPCETQARELDAKLLLAAVAAERGFRVVVGAKKEIDRRIGSMPRGLYLSKSLTKRNVVTYEVLRRLGFAVVCGDEEGLVWPSKEQYLHAKVHPATLERADLLLAWGEQNGRVWLESPGYRGAPIRVVGNARADLLRPELRGLHTGAAEELRERFGRFALVNTNFSRLNHYLPGGSRQQDRLDHGGDAGNDLDLGLAAHKKVLFEHFLEVVPALARSLPDHTLVVRPHPSERRETWREAAAGLGNVVVLHEGAIVPWLLAAEAVVHNGCTTALEAVLLGRLAIAYQPVTSERFDLELPNLVSHRVFDLAGLIAAVRAQVAGLLERDPNEVAKQDELIDEYVASRSGALASERIVDELVAFAPGSRAARRPSFVPWLAAHGVAEARSAARLVEAYLPGHHNNRVYLRHMFPGTTLDDVRSRIVAFGTELGRFQRIAVRPRGADVFEVVER
jgi:surface carbohydrate biosynthesis protein